MASDHPPGSHASEPLLARLADRLEASADEVTAQWHQELADRFDLRPRSVFPGEELLDGMPRMVGWLARSLRNGHSLSPANEESLREVAGHWRDGGFSIEESLLHFRILGRILFERLAELVDGSRNGLEAVGAVEASGRVCYALNLAETVLVATYRDAEQERFTRFGTTLAHEVRDHLGAGLSAVRLLRVLRSEPEAERDARQEMKVLESAESALETANEMVDSVRALTRTSPGSGEPWVLQPLPELVEEVTAEAVARAEAEVTVRVDEGLPGVAVPAAPVALILHNLVANAIKYADEGKAERWVRVQAHREEDGHLVLQVGDNGLGISEAEQERIFARFHRGSQARGNGFGLGLAIARQAARQIGGGLMLESEPGRGSTFGLTIPVEVQAEVPGGEAPAGS